MHTPSVPKKLVILEFKICPKKQVILPYLESACACKNQLVPNMDNKQGQTQSFYFFVNLPQNSQDDLFFGTAGVVCIDRDCRELHTAHASQEAYVETRLMWKLFNFGILEMMQNCNIQVFVIQYIFELQNCKLLGFQGFKYKSIW